MEKKLEFQRNLMKRLINWKEGIYEPPKRKIREGAPIGCKVTLRGENMYVFLEKLIRLSLPRVKDFRGVSNKAFDGRGNYTLGIKEQLIFPEIEYDTVVKVRGMDIVFVTTANTNEEAFNFCSWNSMCCNMPYCLS